MPDLIIKPQTNSGDRLRLQDRTGTDVLTTADSGASLGTISGGTLQSGVTGGAGLTDVPKITNIDHWRLHTSFDGDVNPILESSMERDDTFLADLGTGMSASSGIWTFPSTGYWWVHACMSSSHSNANAYFMMKIMHTQNNSDYTGIWEGEWNSHAGGARAGSMVSAFLDITDLSNHKIKFAVESGEGSATKFVSSTTNRAWFAFVKLSAT